MAILQSTIRAYTTHYHTFAAANDAIAARMKRQQVAFLSHSHKDRDLALGLQGYLKAKGWDVYIDWQDSGMPEKPNRETASRIQSAIKAADWFLFLATQNSMASRWCPWEIGYGDGLKGIDWIVVIPTQDSTGTTYGNEYLDLYRRLDLPAGGKSDEPLMIRPENAYTGTKLSELRP